MVHFAKVSIHGHHQLFVVLRTSKLTVIYILYVGNVIRANSRYLDVAAKIVALYSKTTGWQPGI